MTTVDVAIVGGGPAGSSCAWGLKGSGLKTLVIDKAAFPRHKVCAGWITPGIVEALRLDLEDYARSRVLQPITGFLTGMMGARVRETRYGEVVSHAIRRCEFDDYLLRRTRCELLLNESLRGLERDGEDWVLNGSIRARWVIGAGGHFCPVAKLVVPRPPEQEEPVVLAQESEFELNDDELAGCPVSGERPELYFCPDLAGYGWIVRKGRFLNVGLGREHERHLGDQVAAFVSFLKERGRLTVDPKEPFRGHAYRLRRYAPTLEPPDGVLLIGDSVGLAVPQSGEGIRPAIESGLIAAKVLRELPDAPPQAVSAAFRAQFIHRFGAPRTRTAEPPAWKKQLRRIAAASLMRTGWFTRHVLLDQWFLGRQLEPLFAGS